MLEHLQRLPVEVVERFLEVRDAKALGIPEKLAEYIIHLNEAYNLSRKYRSVSDCAMQLRRKYPELTLPTAKSRVYDAINFFNLDCSVTAPAWDNYFADKMMDLADVNLVAHNFSEVRRCFELAHKYRSRAAANIISPERTRFKPQIVSADMKLDRMGLKENGILEAWRKGKAIIESRDIPLKSKDDLTNDLRRELGITDADYEET